MPLIWPSIDERSCCVWLAMLLIVCVSDWPCSTADCRTDSFRRVQHIRDGLKKLFMALLRFEVLLSAPTIFSSWL